MISDNNPYKSEHDHSYLLSLGEHLFNYKFRSQCIKRDNMISHYLPQVEKINIDDLIITPRKTENSIAFEKAGSYFLKNSNFFVFTFLFSDWSKW